MNVPSFGVSSVTLLNLSSFLCKTEHWPSCPLSPSLLCRSTVPRRERRKCCLEEVAPQGTRLMVDSALSHQEAETISSCHQKTGEFSVPVTLVRVPFCFSLFKDSSHTCPLRMAVRVRPLACLKYSDNCRGLGASELKAVFSLQ